MKGIRAVYEATAEYERLVKLLTDYKKRRRAALLETADRYLETANDWKDALADALNALEPEEGEKTVSNVQRYRAVIDAELREDEQLAALGELMQESEYSKLQTGYSYGVTPEAYVTFRELLPKFDFDGNGTFKQEEVEAAIDSMGGGGNGIVLPGAGGGQSLTVTQQAALWQLANKSWKPAKNPYSTSVGQKVYDALNAETESGIVLPDGTSYTGGLVLPKG